MDQSKKHERHNPKMGTNPFSKLFFLWMMGLFYKGYKKDLDEDDLFDILEEDRSELVGGRLEMNWEKELLRAKAADREPSLSRALTHTFWGWFVFYGTLMGINMLILQVGQPLLLGKLLLYFRNADGVTEEQAYYYAGALTLLGFIMPFLTHQYSLGAYFIGMRMRVACCSLLYRKVLRLNKVTMGESTTGHVVNLMSNDVAIFDRATFNFVYLFIAPLHLLVIAYFLWQQVQVSSVIGLAFILAQTLPVHVVMCAIAPALKTAISVRADERVRLMNEIIQGVQTIKMYVWEKPFTLLVETARKKEIDVFTQLNYLRGLCQSFIVFFDRSALFATLTSYVLMGGSITSDKVFALAALYSLLNQSLAVLLPNAVSLTLEASVSIKRIQTFMLRDEIASRPLTAAPGKGPIHPGLLGDSTKQAVPSKDAANSGLTVERATAHWCEDLNTPTLRDVTFRVHPGQLCAVIGQVGSGKSSLLHALLGELPLTKGSVRVGGVVSYASQEPWLFVGSVRNNILFGQEYDVQRYLSVIKVCALQRDLEMFPHGDQTIVGERGVKLSGGQRARISLARAVYKEADVYLLDDPLSAVDAQVGKHIFEECIKGFLRDKTLLLVTHQLHLLKNSDLIVVLETGAVVNKGAYNQVLKPGAKFCQLLHCGEGTGGDWVYSARRSSARASSPFTVSLEDCAVENTEQELAGESKTTGQVTWGTYASYFLAGSNGCQLANVIIMFLSAQVIKSGADYWVSFWTKMEEEINLTPGFEQQMSQDWSIGIYAALVLTCTVVTILRTIMFYKMCMRSSITLHNTMFSSILRATMLFFNTNPSGRILNRFSKDMGTVDNMLPKTLLETIQVMLVMSGSMLLIVIANYWLLIPLLLVVTLFFAIRIIYLSTVPDLKRLEGITRSPVFTHLSATIDGLTIIRVNNAQEMLRSEFDGLQDLNTSASFLSYGASVAFGFYLDLLSALFTGVVTFSFLLLTELVGGASAGLAISQSMQITYMMQNGIRQTAEVVNHMTSVERVLEYTHVEKESASGESPPKEWPSKGEVRFKNVSLSYAPGENAVLRDLHFTIQPQHKVGIVGRTGAGKSSLIAALFRLALQEGAVVVDGVDTKTLGLLHLRCHISIIPQEPMLFSATIRENLDPFSQYEDHQLWAALEEVELKEAINNLDFHVNEGGSNFSVGQRQLVCLARAILRNNRILVLDEATANVDPHTDSLIQATIRRRFKECTVLTIAHRLNTVMDSDRVLIMDNGKMKEFDHPHLLLERRGALWWMVQETGSVMAEQLVSIAARSYAKEVGVSDDIHKVAPVNGVAVEEQNLTPVKVAPNEAHKEESYKEPIELPKEEPVATSQSVTTETFKVEVKEAPKEAFSILDHIDDVRNIAFPYAEKPVQRKEETVVGEVNSDGGTPL